MPLITLSKSLSSAAHVAEVVRNTDWQVLDQLATLDHLGSQGVRETLRTGAAANEDASPLAKVVDGARRHTIDMIVKRPVTENKAGPPPPPGARPEPAHRTLRGRREQVLGELRALLPPDTEVEISYRILGDGDG